MVNDRAIGLGLMIISVLAILLYFFLLFPLASEEVKLNIFGVEVTGARLADLLVKITVMVGVMGFFGVLAWIGYTLFTTPPPKPLEEVEREIEEELKKLEVKK
ncbi:MAG: transcriptional regulator [Acidilobaceae archaeon]|nr:transcriptional regulator [Acidilobaceae archaeon]